jgi:predicted AlkP superfamily pyrophosphatase or phosphodiesterase
LVLDSVERAQLTNDTTLIVVSDHGLTRVEQQFNPNTVLAKKGWLMTDGRGRITSWRAVAQTFGGAAAIFVKDSRDEKTILAIGKLFHEYHEKPDSPIWRIVSRREASQLGADPNAAFYLDAAPSYTMSPRVDGSTISKASEKATHGHLPSRSETRATLIISGKGIKTGGKIEYARLIDIAPTVARLLGLEMRTARGRVLSEVIEK